MPEQAGTVSHANRALLRHRGYCRVMADLWTAGEDHLTAYLAHRGADPDLPVLPAEHIVLAVARYLTGRWEKALISAEQSWVVAEEAAQICGLTPGHAVAAMVFAQRGEAPESTGT